MIEYTISPIGYEVAVGRYNLQGRYTLLRFSVIEWHNAHIEREFNVHAVEINIPIEANDFDFKTLTRGKALVKIL